MTDRPWSFSASTSAPLLVDEVFHRIASRIADGTYAPGTRLRDQELAAEYAMSRTPIREAMHRLKGIGMVDIYPSRHTVVADVTEATITATREFAALTAGCIVRLAVPRLGEAERERAAELARELAATIARDGDWLSAQSEMLRYLSEKAQNPLFHLFLGDAWYLVIRDLRRDLLSPEQRMQHESAITALGLLIREGDVRGAERAVRDAFGLGGEDPAQSRGGTVAA